MKHKKHLLVIDPTPFSGGSKVATENILRLLDSTKIRVTVLSSDKSSWQCAHLHKVFLVEANCLSKMEQGLGYFLRHLLIGVSILLVRLRFGKIDIAIGASGPGVDLSLYLVKPLLKMEIIQLIHGPVASSKTIAKCLVKATGVHYLKSSFSSMLNALANISKRPLALTYTHFHEMSNGLNDEAWPSRSKVQQPVVFWAASLLKWKGLDLLIKALSSIDSKHRPLTHICYISPKNTLLDISQAPQPTAGIKWHENPANLDEIRSNANIFISTSKNEPFGLSILEAMAAGHCILIPQDGAYWDTALENNIDCIKYQPGNANDLARHILALSNNPDKIQQLGHRAAQVAIQYRASHQYAKIKQAIELSADNLQATRHAKGAVHD